MANLSVVICAKLLLSCHTVPYSSSRIRVYHAALSIFSVVVPVAEAISAINSDAGAMVRQQLADQLRQHIRMAQRARVEEQAQARATMCGHHPQCIVTCA